MRIYEDDTWENDKFLYSWDFTNQITVYVFRDFEPVWAGLTASVVLAPAFAYLILPRTRQQKINVKLKKICSSLRNQIKR